MGSSSRRIRRKQEMMLVSDKCCYCGVRLTMDWGRGNTATIEHITPLSLGGKADESNETLACWPCNNKRAGKDLWEFMYG